MLEQMLSTDNCFVTLTFSEENIMKPSRLTLKGSPTLNPTDLRDWLKRFRFKISPSNVRFFAVGEYGDNRGRPHYHAALFNWKGCLRGRTKRVIGTSRSDWRNCCPNCRLLGETWGLGDVEAGELNIRTATYIAEYAVKKMTKADDPRLYGRHPEFTRMSLKPGIGHDATHQIASDLMRHHLDDAPDVPNSLRHGSRIYPLGRYLTHKLRKHIGKDEKAPEQTTQKIAEKLRPLREAAFNASESFSDVISRESEQPILNMETKMKINRRRVF